MKCLFANEDGQALLEYSLILFLVAVTCIVAFQTLPPVIINLIDRVEI